MLKDLTALIGVCAWPAIILLVTLYFRKELKQFLGSLGELLPRLRKGHVKIAGQEIEAELSELQKEATTAANEVAALPITQAETPFALPAPVHSSEHRD